MTSLAGSTVHFVAKPLFRPAVIVVTRFAP